MDQTSMNLMKTVVDKYGLGGEDRKIVDMGSYDINGTYKELFAGEYIGVDIIPGPNVDVLMDSLEWNAISNVDAVISGQTLEHVADVPRWMAEIMRVLKPGGIVCIIVPSMGPRHDHPIWTGNFPECQVEQIIKGAGFEFMSTSLDGNLPWCLVTGVGRKPEIKLESKKTESKSTKRKDEEI